VVVRQCGGHEALAAYHRALVALRRELLDPGFGELGRFRNLGTEPVRKDQWTAKDWTRPAFIEFVKHEFGRYSTLEYRSGQLVVTAAKPVKPPDQFFGYEHTKPTCRGVSRC